MLFEKIEIITLQDLIYPKKNQQDPRYEDQDQYPAYALKSDDSKKTNNQYPAYAVKSDDGAKDQNDQYPKAYAVKSDNGERPEH